MVDLTRITLITPADFEPRAFARTFAETLDAGEIAAVILDLGEADDRTWRSAAEILCPIAQSREAAFLLRGYPGIARDVGADGVHVSDGATALQSSLKRLKPDFIVGAGDSTTRHGAMTLGEQGPDYVFLGRFGADAEVPAARTLVEWWVDLFTLPCVAMAAESWDTVEDAARAGADFVALRDLVWRDPAGPVKAVRRAVRALAEQAEAVI